MSIKKEGYAPNIAKKRKNAYNNNNDNKRGMSSEINLQESLFSHFLPKNYCPVKEYESDIEAYNNLGNIKLSKLDKLQKEVFVKYWSTKNNIVKNQVIRGKNWNVTHKKRQTKASKSSKGH